MWLRLREEVMFGGPVVVQVHSLSTRVYNLTVPSLQEGGDVSDTSSSRAEAL